MGPLFLCTGGCRSGKSGYAKNWVEERAPNRLYIATAYARDGEMADRIARHQADRGTGWQTLETESGLWREPENLARAAAGVFAPGSGAVLFDCLTLWTSRCFEFSMAEPEVLALAARLFDALQSLACPVAVVTNEVGMGLVPTTPQGRAWRDTLGRVNQLAASRADIVTFMVSGLPLAVKG